MLTDSIFDSTINFEEVALSVFQNQSARPGIYKDYLHSLKINPLKIAVVEQIPFLPISFFKSHEIKDQSKTTEIIFSSSGTTGKDTSKHFVSDLDLYIKSFTKGFNLYYGDIKKYCFLALLPSYLEREGSSLVYMCDYLIKTSSHPLSGFYLENREVLFQKLKLLKEKKQPVILLGVTYALLDLAEHFPLDFPELIVVETGGMKGQRGEMVREEVHAVLKKAFNVTSVHSEYGMTELLSQAWSVGDGIFSCPPWMKVFIRDINDPFQLGGENVTGAINVIDLANANSCSFIATDDIGRMTENNSFEVLGRLESSDLRGCNLLVD